MLYSQWASMQHFVALAMLHYTCTALWAEAVQCTLYTSEPIKYKWYIRQSTYNVCVVSEACSLGDYEKDSCCVDAIRICRRSDG